MFSFDRIPPDTTHVVERMKLLHCVSQDMEALAKMLASAPRAASNTEQMCQTTFRAIAKWRPKVSWERDRGVGQGPEIAQYQHLNNCTPDIPIASPCISSLCSKAECAYPELWQGLILHWGPWYDPYARSQVAIRWIGLNCRTAFAIELLQVITTFLEDCQHA